MPIKGCLISKTVFTISYRFEPGDSYVVFRPELNSHFVLVQDYLDINGHCSHTILYTVSRILRVPTIYNEFLLHTFNNVLYELEKSLVIYLNAFF